MRVRLVLPALAAVLLAASASAQQRRDTGFDLTRLAPSARVAALAGSGGALTGDDPAVLFSNPALLGGEMNRAVSIGYTNHVADVAAGSALYVRDLPSVDVTAAAAARFLSYGQFDRVSDGGVTDGTFSASEAALSLTVAREVAPRLRAGGTAHALFASIDDASAQALTADLGLAYHVPSQLLTIGASVHHVGSVLSSLGSVDDELPTDLRLSVAKRLRYLPLTITATGYELHAFGDGTVSADSASALRKTADQLLDHVAVGGELQLGGRLAVRAGFNPRRSQDLDSGARIDLAGVSFGLGVAVRRFALDYAYNGWSQYGGQHQFGIRTRL